MIFVMTVAYLPLAILLWHATPLLIILGQDAQAAEYAGLYMRIQLPGIYLQCLFDGISIFYTAMEKSYIPMLVQIVCIPLHALWCYLLIYVCRFDIYGCAMAVNVTYSLCLVAIKLVINASNDQTVR